MSQEIPDAIILAGGLGTRLREVVIDKQKVMAEVDGKPFVAYLFRQLSAAGVRRVILALGYRGEDAFTEALLYKPNNMTLLASIEHEPLGTAGALRNAIPYVQSPEVLVTNGDSIVDYPMERFVGFHHNSQAAASMLLCYVPDAARYGRVLLRENSSEIVKFAEKSKTADGEALINAGVYIVPTALLASLPPGPRSFETGVLPSLCDGRLHGLATRARFLDIGVPEDYFKASKFFQSIKQKL